LQIIPSQTRKQVITSGEEYIFNSTDSIQYRKIALACGTNEPMQIANTGK
jgi:hypothetical protein